MDKRGIIAKMTIEEKAALLTGRDFWTTKDFEKYNIPSLTLSDGPHGLRKQEAASDHLGLNASVPATCFPTAATMANSWDPALGETLGEALGQEAAAQNVHVVLGPGVNIKRNPRCGRNFEYFSEDPYLAGKMAAGYIRGIQKNGTSACVKHFACNSQEERRMTSDSVLDERTLREIYLTAFEIAVKEGGTHAIMSSYNQINGVYANENKHLLRDILRGEWKYDGVVVSDWAGSNSRVAAAEAGSDLEMPACKYGIDDVVAAVKDGSLDEKYVDECVGRILTLIEETSGHRTGEHGFDAAEHHLLAQKCAEESIVLLQNNGVLPIEDKRKVAFIGDFVWNPRYQGAGSSVVNPTLLESVSKCMGEYGLEIVGAEKGFDRYGKKKRGLARRAVKLAAQCDTVLLFLGLDEVSEAEGLDRENISLPRNQLELYKMLKATGKRIVVVLSCGSVVDTRALSGADALVYACLGGQAGARAVMNVLTGIVNPSGKLAETFPVRYADCSSAAHFPGKKLTVEYREGLYVGYRYFNTAQIPVRFPFGFGLSYTTFSYYGLNVEEGGVRFSVKNTGKRAGAEIAQLYIGKKDSKVFRPVRELKGFAKVHLLPDEVQEVFIPFDDKTFRYFNVSTDGWEEEGGEYQICVGASSRDIRLTGTIERAGTCVGSPYLPAKLPSYYSGKAANVGDAEFSALLGRDIPSAEYPFTNKRKTRMVIHENCTVADLRYSRGWTGRAFAAVIRFAVRACKALGMRTTANTLVMGVVHQPVRGLAKYGGMSRRQMEGLLTMFNGKFFRGLGQFLKKDKKERKKAGK